MMKRLRPLLGFLFGLWAMLAIAQQELEIIPLRASTVERVLPALRPLLEPGATLSGMNNQLFLRASAGNRAEIRRALAAIDRPARQLEIRISRQRGADGNSAGMDGQARVWGTQALRQENASQVVRALEGSPAQIQIGQSLPVPMRQVILGPSGAVVSDTTVYRDIAQGFQVLPTVSGNLVTLELFQQAESAGPYGAGSVNGQRLSTTVSGRLGEWIRVGGSGQSAEAGQFGTAGLSSREMRDQQSLWLRVDEVH